MEKAGEHPVKTILAVTATGLFLMFALFHLLANDPFVSTASPSSQIFIHGTPVCVFQKGKEIVARIGKCGSDQALPDSGHPFQGRRAPNLPPGHPPIGPAAPFDGNRPVQI